MKINEVEKITGITSANIRYYERKELLAPKRENENNYRLYDTDDIERLKQIKILRMMGIPIADIKEILAGNLDLKTSMTQRIDQLTEEEKNILTDACKIFSMKGYDVHLVEGEVHNIKITYPYDLRVAMTLLEEGK